jgi:hypothetical protein
MIGVFDVLSYGKLQLTQGRVVVRPFHASTLARREKAPCSTTAPSGRPDLVLVLLSNLLFLSLHLLVARFVLRSRILLLFGLLLLFGSGEFPSCWHVGSR